MAKRRVSLGVVVRKYYGVRDIFINLCVFNNWNKGFQFVILFLCLESPELKSAYTTLYSLYGTLNCVCLAENNTRYSVQVPIYYHIAPHVYIIQRYYNGTQLIISILLIIYQLYYWRLKLIRCNGAAVYHLYVILHVPHYRSTPRWPDN